MHLVACAASEPPLTPTRKPPTSFDIRIRAWHDARCALFDALKEAGLVATKTLCESDQTPTGRLWLALDQAHRAMENYDGRRILRLERILRSVLALDGLTDDQRNEILTGLYGAGGAVRNTNALSESEASMIANYRAMARSEDRAMVRTLFTRLAETGGAQ